jgi:two-component system LytT family response regulator
LLKPLRIQDLKDALSRFEERISSKYVGASVKVLIENCDASSNEFKRIVLPILNGFEVIRVNDIIRCESERNYTSFYLTDGRKVLVSKTLKDFEQILNSFGFFRIHQSHLVNLSFVKKYFRGHGGEVEMSDGSIIPISRSKKDEFVNLFVG